jgi:putative transposase
MVLTGINPLWIADITYIRLELEFVYLAVLLDAYSRRVISWALDWTLRAELTLAALQMALARLGPSLRSGGPVRLPGFRRSGSGARRAPEHEPARDPVGQRRSRIVHEHLKHKEVYRQEDRDLAEARASIGRFLEQLYNQKRLHAALNYRPPAQFQQGLPPPSAPPPDRRVTV